ncbi:hypothetical protein D3C87_2144740 [compost metagenome]
MRDVCYELSSRLLQLLLIRYVLQYGNNPVLTFPPTVNRCKRDPNGQLLVLIVEHRNIQQRRIHLPCH